MACLDGLHFKFLNEYCNMILRFKSPSSRAFKTHLHSNATSPSFGAIRLNPLKWCVQNSPHLTLALSPCMFTPAHKKFLKRVLHLQTAFLNPPYTLIKEIKCKD